MILREDEVDPLVLRVAIALFETDRDASDEGWDLKWADLPGVSGTLIDKDYWLRKAQDVVTPPESLVHSKP